MSPTDRQEQIDKHGITDEAILYLMDEALRHNELVGSDRLKKALVRWREDGALDKATGRARSVQRGGNEVR